ncbi:hypothetical protein UA08_01144 [Talaromyces atroroseus]|uniref:Allergen Asp f 4 n=1 Tax=Talaromyces atroroseus TaxID=1441469 RepID=A0A1Q5QBA0_TALAT|nr:hypothetical protein UA08_01144 [Talaromyces atroroseus]OKL63204.1 hypothetical protein UA08_01144 [Talaromyces atroroseus]
MQIKNTIVLLTALLAGSATARLHGHERRSHHEKREVAATATAESTATTTSSGFGGVTSPSGTGDTYCGNVGIPYGSNIIEITEDELDSYNWTVTLDGSFILQEYTAYFWNNCNEEGELAGFFDTTFPLTVTIGVGEKSYVAIDVDSQGAFVTSPTSVGVPRSTTDGIIMGFWGEFNIDTTINDGWSGFDVSALVALDNGKTDYPGLALTGDGQTSYITNSLGSAYNAYSETSEASTGGIGGNVVPGKLALTAYMAYNGQSI